MKELRLVVDHGPLWVPPAAEARAQAVVASLRELTAPGVRAQRAFRESLARPAALTPADVEAIAAVARHERRLAAVAAWLAGRPLLAGAVAAAAAMALAYLSGGVR